MKLEEYLASRRREVDAALDRLLPRPDGPAGTIAAAMRYAVEAGGKRLRPIMALAACEACGGTEPAVLEASCALELIHTYSLIHDDLPAMDDDDLRRGRPTTHREFGEAEAILAGDALHTLAFEILAAWPKDESTAPRRIAAVESLARGAGIRGMVGGQIADIEAERSEVDLERLRWIHRHKTGALFAASAELGAIHAGADPAVREAMAEYGRAVGLAFQVADDILDCTATAETLGKTPGKDVAAGKATYPALLGLEASRQHADQLVQQALEALANHDLTSEPLAGIAAFSISRTR